MELLARLTLKDQFGRGFVVEDGYGCWHAGCCPVVQTSCGFYFASQPPPPRPGTYEVKLEIQQAQGLPRLEINQTIQLKAALEERVSNLSAASETK